MLAGHSAYPSPVKFTYSLEQSVSRPLSTQALQPIPVGFTYSLEQSVSRPLSTQELHPIPVEFTYFLQQRRRAVLAGHSAPRHYTHPGRIHLRATAAKEGSVSRPLSQAIHPIPGGFLLPTVVKKGSVSQPLSTQALHSSRSDSLTSYSSEGGQS